MNLGGIAGSLKEPLGPLPVGAWALIGGAGIAVFVFLRRKSGPAATGNVTLTPNPTASDASLGGTGLNGFGTGDGFNTGSYPPIIITQPPGTLQGPPGTTTPPPGIVFDPLPGSHGLLPNTNPEATGPVQMPANAQGMTTVTPPSSGVGFLGPPTPAPVNSLYPALAGFNPKTPFPIGANAPTGASFTGLTPAQIAAYDAFQAEHQ